MNYEDQLDFVIKFQDFEDVIALAKESSLDDLPIKLYSFEDKYYLYIEFPEEQYEENEIDNLLSIILEYGQETNVTIHRIEEYGKCILDDDVFPKFKKVFWLTYRFPLRNRFFLSCLLKFASLNGGRNEKHS